MALSWYINNECRVDISMLIPDIKLSSNMPGSDNKGTENRVEYQHP